MKNSAKLTGRKLESFLSRLSELVDVLPSQETKSQIDQELDVLIKFLEDFRTRLNSLPTVEDTEDIPSTIETIKDYVRVAESDPVMSRVLGFRLDKGMSRRPSQNSLTEQDRIEAKAIAQELKRLSHEKVEDKLADTKKYTVAMLRQIAGELGLKIPSKSTRSSIIETIIKEMENLRGYNLLRHGGDANI